MTETINAEDMVKILRETCGDHGFACPLIGMYPCEKDRRGCACHENYLKNHYAPTHDGWSDSAVLQEVIAIIEAHFIKTFGTERVYVLRRFASTSQSSTPLNGWRPVRTQENEDEVPDAPADEDLILGWWKSNDGGRSYFWKQEIGLARCTKGRWRHGRATHWQPLVKGPPASTALQVDLDQWVHDEI